jgi:peptidoglycan/LPS O-acetylase OafA/YrhL
MDALDRRYRSLDLLRGVAAILVALYHLGQREGEWVPVGYGAVDFFFSLSGFVLAASYTSRLANGLSVAKFAEMRLIRLYPMYLIGLAIGLAVAIAQAVKGCPGCAAIGEIALAVPFNLLMLPTPFSEALFPLNGPSWSLLLELLVNIVFATVLFRLSSRVLTVVASVSLIILACLLAPPHYSNVGFSWNTLLPGLARTLFSFTIGMLLYRSAQGATRFRSWAFVVPVAVLLAIMMFPIDARYETLRELLAIAVASPIVMILGSRWEPPRIADRVCEFLGDISFPLYAIHWPLTLICAAIGKRFGLGLGTTVIGFGIAALALSALLAYAVDGPARRLLSRIASLRQSAKLQLE